MQCISVLCTETLRTAGERVMVSDEEGLIADKSVCQDLGFQVWYLSQGGIRNPEFTCKQVFDLV